MILINQDAVNQRHKDAAVQFFNVFILLEERHPIPFRSPGCDRLLHFFLHAEKGFLLFLNDFGVAVAELKVFRLVDDPIRKVFVEPELELLIPLNLFFELCNLRLIVERFAILGRKPLNHFKRLFQIYHKFDLVMDGTEHLFLNLFCADAVWAAGPVMLIR